MVRPVSRWRRQESPLRAIAGFDLDPDKGRVQLSVMIDRLSKGAPSITILTLCASLLAAWVEAPLWLPTALAILVGSLALVLLLTRGRRRNLERAHVDLEAEHKRSWIAYELAGSGTPPGYYILGFFAFLTVALTGFQSPYAWPAWAAFALGGVWGIANREYPAEEETDP